MISRTGKYALNILGYLAGHHGDWIQGSQISSDTGIPQNYLSKILNQLRKRGFVLSQKGWGGGFQLREDAAATPILQVLEVFEGERTEGECVFGFRQCDDGDPCSLHSYWESIQSSYRDMLSSVTIADLHTGGKA
jgi:Rrf2 family transcriptional regulator, iron-sulfur cluster assembly transcription factor